MIELPKALVVGFLGSIVGIAIGMTGVGGGTLSVPLLTIVAGQPIWESVGTALLFSTLVKSYAAWRYYLDRNIDFRVLHSLLIGGLPGVIGGSFLMQRLSGEHNKKTMIAAVGGIVAITAGVSLYRTFRTFARTSSRAGTISVAACLIGIEIGFSSAGAGALGSVLLFNTTTLSATSVVGTDLAFGLALSLTGGLIHLSTGNWHPQLLIPFVTGGFVGVFLGTRLSRRVSPARLRQVVLGSATILGLALLKQGL